MMTDLLGDRPPLYKCSRDAVIESCIAPVAKWAISTPQFILNLNLGSPLPRSRLTGPCLLTHTYFSTHRISPHRLGNRGRMGLCGEKNMEKPPFLVFEQLSHSQATAVSQPLLLGKWAVMAVLTVSRWVARRPFSLLFRPKREARQVTLQSAQHGHTVDGRLRAFPPQDYQC